MRNKKIIFFVRFLDEGGGTKVISELSLNLPNNIERTIVLLENKISYSYRGKLILLNLPFSKNLFLKFFRFLIGFLRFRKIIKEEKPDYVVSVDRIPNIINVLSTKKSVPRLGTYLLLKSSQHFTDKLYKILIKFLFNRSAKIVANSQGIKEDLVKNFRINPNKIKICPNFIDLKKIEILTREPLEFHYQSIFKNPTIINVGKLNDQKGQWHLIRAFKVVKERKKDLKLVILGEGQLRPYLTQLIKDLNLENDVYLLGWQKNPFKFLAKSKLFISSSFSEGLPSTILEAMACGLPVISTDGPTGPREILAPDSQVNYRTDKIEYAPYGILVPVCDGKFYGAKDPLSIEEKILSRAIEEIFTNKNLYSNLRKKSKERSRDFEVKKIIKNWNFLWE